MESVLVYHPFTGINLKLMPLDMCKKKMYKLKVKRLFHKTKGGKHVHMHIDTICYSVKNYITAELISCRIAGEPDGE